jgi:hypothetical protein
MDAPSEHCSPEKKHCFVVGSQHPSWQAGPVVQHGDPEKPHEPNGPPSAWVTVLLAQDAAGVPVIEAVCAPCVQVIVQLDPPPLTEQLTPLADCEPHKQSCALLPLMAALQHAAVLPTELEHDVETTTINSPIDARTPRGSTMGNAPPEQGGSLVGE